LVAHPLTPGDFNSDGFVDQADYQVWQSAFGSIDDLAADANFDGIVDAADFTVWRDNLSAAPAPLIAVPEPAGAWPAIVGLAAVMRRGRRVKDPEAYSPRGSASARILFSNRTWPARLTSHRN
jgi:hypothetical protein